MKDLFRKSYNEYIINDYIDRFDHCLINEFPSEENPFVVVSVFKVYLQSLPDSVIPKEQFKRITEVDPTSSKEDKVKLYKDIIASLPLVNSRTLCISINIACLLKKNNKEENVSGENIAALFAEFLCPVHDAYSISIESIAKFSDFIAFSMDNFQEVF